MIHVCYPGKHNSTLFLQINKQESRVCFLSREHRDRHSKCIGSDCVFNKSPDNKVGTCNIVIHEY